MLLEVPPDRIAGAVFNAGRENLTVMEIARTVKRVVGDRLPDLGEIPIVRTPSRDPRSYHISSERIRRQLGFRPERTIVDGIEDLILAFASGEIPDALEDARYYNVRRMSAMQLV